MHRRLLAFALAAFSFAAVTVATSNVADAKPHRDRHAGTHSTDPGKSIKRTRAERGAVRARHASSSRRVRAGGKRSARRTGATATRVHSRRAAGNDRRRTRAQRSAARTLAAKQPAEANLGYDSLTGTPTSTGSGNFTGRSNGGNFFGGSSDVVAEARRWVGTNPTGRRSLWCARFMNFVLRRTGHEGTGSDMAHSFARYGRRVNGPRIGAIAVMSRGRGGHVGVVSGIDERGNPIIISGNHGNRVAESTYPRGRIRAYVMPGT